MKPSDINNQARSVEPPPTALSPRQRQVHDLMIQGLSRSEIANRLGLALGTVKLHIAKVFRKTSTRSQVELMVKHYSAAAHAAAAEHWTTLNKLLTARKT